MGEVSLLFRFAAAISLQFSHIQGIVPLSVHAGCPSYHSIPGRADDFTVLQSIQTGSAAHPVSYSVGTRGLFLSGVKRAGREINLHLVLS